MAKLKYEKYNNSNNVIAINLHNGYTVIAVSGFSVEKESYTTTLLLKANGIDTWKLVEKAEFLEFNETPQTINLTILKQVSKFLEEGFFDYYIKRYEYETKCFDKGNEFFEKGKVYEKSCLSCDYWDTWDDCK